MDNEHSELTTQDGQEDLAQQRVDKALAEILDRLAYFSRLQQEQTAALAQIKDTLQTLPAASYPEPSSDDGEYIMSTSFKADPIRVLLVAPRYNAELLAIDTLSVSGLSVKVCADIGGLTNEYTFKIRAIDYCTAYCKLYSIAKEVVIEE